MCSGKLKGKQITRPPLLRLALLVKTNLLSNCMLLYQFGLMNSHWLGNMEPNSTFNVCVAACSWGLGLRSKCENLVLPRAKLNS